MCFIPLGYLAKVITTVSAERKKHQAFLICKLWSQNQPVDFKSNPAGSQVNPLPDLGLHFQELPAHTANV